MTISQEAWTIFSDAEELHNAALERLEQGDVRDAAEKAWGATLRAASAMLLSVTGEEPERSPAIRRGIDNLARDRKEFTALLRNYRDRQDLLHGDCFYHGICEPREPIEREIRETETFISAAKWLAELPPLQWGTEWVVTP